MIPYAELLSRIPFETVEPLDASSVRFTYPQAREVPLAWTMVLEDGPRLETLEPTVIDRKAVATQIEGLRYALVESFEQGRGSALFTTAGIDDPAQWRDVLIDHYCRPKWIYTNAQRTFSLVEKPGPRYRVAELPSLESLHEFRTLYVRTLPDPHKVMDFGHFDAAESHVMRELAMLQVRAMPLLRKGERRRTLLLQAAGTRPGPRGRAVSVYLAHVEGRAELLEIEPERCDAYTVLNRLHEQLPAVKGHVVEACATCAGFRFSGMSRDMSGGTSGYCRRRLEAARASGLPMSGMDVRPRYGTVVSVFDRCARYETIADADREVEFCQHGGKPGDP